MRIYVKKIPQIFPLFLDEDNNIIRLLKFVRFQHFCYFPVIEKASSLLLRFTFSGPPPNATSSEGKEVASSALGGRAAIA